VFAPGGDAPVAAARTDAGGAYRIPVERGGAYLVTAAAPAYAPAGADALADADTELPALLLRAGAAIEGTVRVASAPASRATVRASLPGTSGRTLALGLDGLSLVADAQGVAWRSVAAETDAAGRFSLAGLATRTYRLEVEALDGAGAAPYEAQDVAAPGVAAFDEPVARVSVTVRGGGEPLSGATVEVRREDGAISSLRTVRGSAIALARPGERLSLAVSANGYEPVAREIVSRTSEEAFDLLPDVRLATLVVTLRSEDGVALPVACDFDLEPDHGFASRRRAMVDAGRFLLEDLEPDVYRVVAALPGEFAPASARVALARGATTVLPLDVFAGGRIVVRFLTDGPLPDVWIEGAADPRASRAIGGPVRWEVRGDTLESGLLAPGAYVLHVLAPDGPRSFAVEVRPTEIVRLLVPLG
jgi:hypothetical protein